MKAWSSGLNSKLLTGIESRRPSDGMGSGVEPNTDVNRVHFHRIATRFSVVNFLAVVVLFSSACGKGGREGAPVGQTGPSSPTTAVPDSSPGAAKPRDLASVKVCELVTAAEIAAAAGGKNLGAPTSVGSVCINVVELPEGAESYNISVQPVEVGEALLRTMSDLERGESVGGLGDQAYMGQRAVGKGYVLRIIRHGDLALEVSGNRKSPLVEIARIALSRLR